MELAYYSDYAVRLVNSEDPSRGKDELTSVDAVRALFGAASQAARRANESDVTRLRAVRGRLRAVFEAADEGDEVRAVDLLNALLMEFPVSPQVSGHEFRDDDGRPKWHMHIADHPANATAGYAATAAMGLAFQLTDLGVDRLGLCRAAPCRNAYLDTSTNRSRRYCSDRCATRANVAAYRARKRLEERPSRGDEAAADRTARTDRTGRTAEKTQASSPTGDR
ncbi:CGNR zinc finger domain-containing protein [Streptomyces sp. NPDC048639]|uniref:CGNR zinc finger domain-containing protein n=1 Tax=Streptomyces sp. NPDC048639 TaxID=3365581 RepID=UPI00371C6B5C